MYFLLISFFFYLLDIQLNTDRYVSRYIFLKCKNINKNCIIFYEKERIKKRWQFLRRNKLIKINDDGLKRLREID